MPQKWPCSAGLASGVMKSAIMYSDVQASAKQNYKVEKILSIFSIAATFLIYAVIFKDQYSLLVNNFLTKNYYYRLEILIYTILILTFSYSIFVYLISRFVHYRILDKGYGKNTDETVVGGIENAPSVTILVPSYCEQISVIWQTIMSAALVDYPGKHIVLLLDNPQHPAGAADQQLLAESRSLTGMVAALFAPIAGHFAIETTRLEILSRSGGDQGQLHRRAAGLYGEAADFLESVASRILDGELGGPDNHVRRFFIENMLLAPARGHRASGEALLAGPLDLETLTGHLRRLSIMFKFDIEMFERKRFANCTHAPNKASNLNAYLGLQGGSFKIALRKGQHWLDRVESQADADISIRDAQFVVVLDADSFMHPAYLQKTMAVMLAPGNERVAVAQTPYKAIPGSSLVLERAAGASTDVHFCVAAGMSALGAGFWVGATALVRTAALHDIAEQGEERGFSFPVFIPDKTLIEDAHATVSLVTRGWRIHHLPEHLNWSSTPGDFGSLVIQRRRWANGGLLILPVLMRHLRRAPRTAANVMEGFLRFYHLLAAPITGIAGLIIVLYPFDTSLASKWVSLPLAPYLYLHGRDLKSLGYRWIDLFRIFSLNIILLPVVLGGVLKSVEQLIYGRKIPFARTPKIHHRTTAPPLYLIAALAMIAWSVYCFCQAAALDLRGRAFPSFFFAIALIYAVTEFVGLWHMTIDLAQALWNRIVSALTMGWRWTRRAVFPVESVLTGAQ
jgi:cellulose synthase (UDP-forming)